MTNKLDYNIQVYPSDFSVQLADGTIYSSVSVSETSPPDQFTSGASATWTMVFTGLLSGATPVKLI